MHRTTIFLPDDLGPLVREYAKRRRVAQAEVVRLALRAYLEADAAPWPRSVGMGKSGDRSVGSENVKSWVRNQWASRDEGQRGSNAPDHR